MAQFQALVQNVVSGLQAIAGVVALGALVWAGILWMTAAGNPDQLRSARAALIAAVVGFVIAMGADTIVGVVTGILGTS